MDKIEINSVANKIIYLNLIYKIFINILYAVFFTNTAFIKFVNIILKIIFNTLFTTTPIFHFYDLS